MSIKIAFREIGSGPIIILLHGFAGSGMHWDPLINDFSKKYRVIIPNLSHLYMGLQYLSFSQQLEEFQAWVDKNFPDQKLILCGISYGAALSWGFAARYPDHVERIILINPLPPKPLAVMRSKFMRLLLGARLGKLGIAVILSTRFGQDFIKKIVTIFRLERADLWGHTGRVRGRKLLFVAHILHHFAFILRNENWHRWQQKLQHSAIPSLLITDPEDPLFKKDTYKKFYQQIGPQRIYEIHGAGHMAIQTRPEKICDVIQNYLDVEGRPTAA